MEFLTNTKFNFIGGTRYAFILSALLILTGVVSLIVQGGPALSIDFTGGTILQVRVTPAPEISNVRDVLEGAGFTGLQVQDFGSAEDR